MTKSGLTRTGVIVIIVMALLLAITVRLLQPTYYTYKFKKEAQELYASVKKEIEERKIDDVSSINASNIEKVLGIKLKNIEQITISFDENNKLVISVQANRNASKKVIQVKEEELIEVKDEDVIAPLMTLKGKIKITIELNEEYIELGAVANDYIDGDLTSKIVITNNIDNKVVGTYYVTYSVSDSSENNATIKREVVVKDTIKPVITLKGNKEINVTKGKDYIELGATSLDNYDGDITKNIAITSNVDTNTTGIYYVNYSVSDSSGNKADEVIRTVIVVDNTTKKSTPGITLNGEKTINISVGTNYIEQGAKATDDIDGTITNKIVITSNVNKDKIGTYQVRYNVINSNGTKALEVIRIVNVIDKELPVIELNGSKVINIEVGEIYTEYFATSLDNYDGDITENVVITNNINKDKVGSYYVKYNASDSSGNKAKEVIREVNVVDRTKPIITLLGSPIINLIVGQTYTDEGATSLDNYDGNITSRIVKTNNININKAGTYIITYNVSDSSGNNAIEVIRTINYTDNTKPIITLNGLSTMEIEVGSTYIDSGATATDNTAGDLTENIVVTNNVNTNLLGTYYVKYNVTDAVGNVSVEVIRTVNVVDTTKPTITLIGETNITIEYGNTYTDEGATSLDNYDGNISENIVVINLVNTNVIGTYQVRYNVKDSSNNNAVEVIRTVNVVDATIPVITLIGESTVTIEYGSTYIDEGATAIDNYDGNIIGNIVVTNPVNTNQLGTYIVKYNVQDSSDNNAIEVTRTVNIVDSTIPVITLIGDSIINIEEGKSYIDLGATATDNHDGNITESIVVTNNVNTNVLGTYLVTYNVKDSSNNSAVEVVRTVNVTTREIPTINLIGLPLVTIEVGSTYTDLGATASDITDGDLTENIVVTNNVNTSILGTYLVNYNVKDSLNNNATEVTRTVNVVDTTKPVISLIGDTSITIEYGSTYTDEGATASDNYDGTITNSIIVTNPVNINQVGTYIVKYNVKDSSNNNATEVTRTVNVVDTTKPVISLIGDTSLTIEYGSTYTDEGATATDNYDGNITGNIVVTNPVNINQVGTYIVKYNVKDSSNNNAIEVTRTVNIVDSTIPTITLIGNTSVEVGVGTSYIDLGATASDNYDGNITESIVVTNPVNTSMLSTYTIKYNVKDSSNNSAIEVTRTVNVVDKTIPVITLIGDPSTEVEIGSTYNDLGATATDNYDGNITESIVETNPVNTNALGTYYVKYNVKDSSNNNAIEVIRMVTVVDTTIPLITLIGDSTMEIEVGSTYIDLGATAFDSIDGDITEDIVVTNPVNTNVLGTYYVKYNVKDSSNNDAVEVTRTVTVVDTTIPLIILIGEPIINLTLGSTYTDSGATATDNHDGNITESIVVTNPVNTNVVGSYTVTYNVKDSSNNNAIEVTRTVNIVDTTIPLITLIGESTITIEVGTTYTDLGATALDNYDDDITEIIAVTNNVNADILGTYIVTYNVKDSSDNNAVEVIRTVNVVDTTKPVITIIGPASMEISYESEYIDLGVTALDNYDGNITESVVVTNTVNTSELGTYYVRYNVADTSGNTAEEIIRTITVVDVISEIVNPGFIGSEGVNAPMLIDGLDAIKWNTTTSTWDIVDNPNNDTSWYDYDNKEWANARTQDGSMWVWIPRYIYKITSNWHVNTTGTIEVKFSKGIDDTISGTEIIDDRPEPSASNAVTGHELYNGGKYTNHPAFTFGTTELTGIWVAKFEATASEGVANGYTADSTCPISGDNVATKTIQVLPNVASWRCQTIGNAFTAARNMEASSVYGWNTASTLKADGTYTTDTNNVDTHLMKNVEWGAVSYLSKSQYGKNTEEIYINNNQNYITGCAANSATAGRNNECLNTYESIGGVRASTTGTIYGIYDLSGSAWERVSAYVDNANGNLAGQGASIVNATSKYKDIYTKNTTDDQANNYALTTSKKGDAIWETSNNINGSYSWFSDYSYMPKTDGPWFIRGGVWHLGSSAGAFNFAYTSGGVNSLVGFRPVVLVNAGL